MPDLDGSRVSSEIHGSGPGGPSSPSDQPHNGRRRLHMAFVFAWFDFWVGLYFDRKKRQLYFFPIPFFGVKFWLEPSKPVEPEPATESVRCVSRAMPSVWLQDPIYLVGRIHGALLSNVSWTETGVRTVESAKWQNPERELQEILRLFMAFDHRNRRRIDIESELMRELLGRAR